MCGRYALYAETEELIAAFAVQRDAGTPRLEPRYNIAPTQDVPIVVAERGARRLRLVRWGLVPSQWSAPDERRAPLINARAESVASRPVFRHAYARSRCLIPASGFFEWRREAGVRQPYYVTFDSSGPLAFAGLHDRWQRDDRAPIPSCAIITVPPNSLVAGLHDRMPALLSAEDWEPWLDSDAPREVLQALLRPAEVRLAMYPVTPRMNHHAYAEPDAVAPVTAPSGGGQLSLEW
jgi:putative SOS response-associated peptidase YedK